MSDRKVLQHDWVVRGFGVRSERSARCHTAKTHYFLGTVRPGAHLQRRGTCSSELDLQGVLRDANAGTNHVYCLSAKAVRSTKKNASTVGVHNCTTFTALLCKLNTTSTAAYICWNNSRKTKTLRNQNQLSEAVALGAPPVCFLKSF